MDEKGLTDSERHELWLTDIENRVRYLESLHSPSFSSFRERELEFPVSGTDKASATKVVKYATIKRSPN